VGKNPFLSSPPGMSPGVSQSQPKVPEFLSAFLLMAPKKSFLSGPILSFPQGSKPSLSSCLNKKEFYKPLLGKRNPSFQDPSN